MYVEPTYVIVNGHWQYRRGYWRSPEGRHVYVRPYERRAAAAAGVWAPRSGPRSSLAATGSTPRLRTTARPRQAAAAARSHGGPGPAPMQQGRPMPPAAGAQPGHFGPGPAPAPAQQGRPMPPGAGAQPGHFGPGPGAQRRRREHLLRGRASRPSLSQASLRQEPCPIVARRLVPAHLQPALRHSIDRPPRPREGQPLRPHSRAAVRFADDVRLARRTRRNRGSDEGRLGRPTQPLLASGSVLPADTYRTYWDRSSSFSRSCRRSRTYFPVIGTVCSPRSGASKESSSRSLSITVCRRLAPMFSIR